MYRNAQAPENVSLQVHKGGFVAVVGLNGAGKTTLFNAVSGLIPCRRHSPRRPRPLRNRTTAMIAPSGRASLAA
jgi:branched-chain amino acid transport system ATP-binding protein